MRSDLPMNAFQFVGTCRIVREIAQGGMCVVLLADQLGIAGFTKTVAIRLEERKEFMPIDLALAWIAPS